MFQWDKSISALDLPVDTVVQLFRSMRDIQLALPGLPAQEATAYLCQHQTAAGIRTVAAFHLHKSGRTAFYVSTPREVASDKAEAMLDQATFFVESMGFLMTDLDIHLLNDADRVMLWSSLPLAKGSELPVKSPAATTPPAAVGSGERSVGKPAEATVAEDLQKVARHSAEGVNLQQAGPARQTPAEPPPAIPTSEADAAAGGSVDDLLAAVEALRTRRPEVRTRKKSPGPEELKRRRQELRKNLGRILSSL